MRYFILSLCAVLLIAPLCSCAGRTAAGSDGSSLPDAVVGMSEDPAAAASGTTVGSGEKPGSAAGTTGKISAAVTHPAASATAREQAPTAAPTVTSAAAPSGAPSDAPTGAATGQPRKVPPVDGCGRDAARRILEDAGFTVRIVVQPAAGVAAGAVIRQQPGSGETLPAGGTVTIVCARDAVSAADELTPTGDRNAVWRMPDLIGRDFALCGTLIARGDVDWTVAELIDDPSVPTYGVIRQDPAPGAQVRYGDRLSLTVSYPRLRGIKRLTPDTLVLRKGETAQIDYQILLPEPLTDAVLLPYPAAYDGSVLRLTDTVDLGGGCQTVRLQGLAPGRTKVTLSFRNVTGGPQIVVTTTVTVTE